MNTTQPTPVSQSINTPATTQTSQSTTLNKKKKPWLLIFLVILLLSVNGVLGYKYYQLKQQTDKKQSQAQLIESSTSEPTSSSSSKLITTEKPYTENTNISNQKKYVNPKLGISFLYLAIDAFDNKTKFTTKEIGNKVYIYPENRPCETGQYIEVFDKDPSKTLERIIKTTLLENYSEEKCVVSIKESSNNHPTNYPASYIEATIGVPGEFTNMEEMSEKVRECPRPYTTSMGLAYFLMDQDHPDKFAFFSIGQYGIAADKDNVMWQSTIKFID